MLNTKEWYELMEQFEKDFSGNMEREHKDMWIKKAYYCNGEMNNLFTAYLMGYQSHKCIANMG